MYFTQDRFIGLYCTSPKKKYLSQTLSTFSFSMMIWILNTQNGFIWIPVFRCHCFLVLLKYLLDHLNFKLWMWGWLHKFFLYVVLPFSFILLCFIFYRVIFREYRTHIFIIFLLLPLHKHERLSNKCDPILPSGSFVIVEMALHALKLDTWFSHSTDTFIQPWVLAVAPECSKRLVDCRHLWFLGSLLECPLLHFFALLRFDVSSL